jgi:hypothetical protein
MMMYVSDWQEKTSVNLHPLLVPRRTPSLHPNTRNINTRKTSMTGTKNGKKKNRL